MSLEPAEYEWARTPPQNTEAEQSVLGSMLISRQALEEVMEILDATDFYKPNHGQIFEIAAFLNASSSPVDALTVSAELQRQGSLARIGGAEYLHTLIAGVPSAASAGYYARLVREQAVLRRLVEAGTRIANMGYEAEGTEVDGVVEAAQNELHEVTSRTDSQGGRTVGSIIDSVIEGLDRPARYIPSPWPNMNGSINGFRPGALYVIGARPGQGKSIMGAQIAHHMCGFGNVALSSLEMSAEEILERILAFRANIHMSSMARRTMGPQDWERLARLQSELATLPMHIDDRSGVTVQQIRAHARKVARKGRLAGVVVDYLQLIQTPRHMAKRHRWEAVGEFSRELKALARDLDVPVIALAQLNRESESGPRRAPSMSDLRESGNIEQDADVVMLIQRGWSAAEERHTEDVDVHVAKNRHGPSGKFTLLWRGEFARLDQPPW